MIVGQRVPTADASMKIGILSDTHNDVPATARALRELNQWGVQTLFHCGDLISPEIIRHFDGLELYFVHGNMDRHQAPAYEAAALEQSGVHWLGAGHEVALGGKRIAITHGDREDLVERLLADGPHYLLLGHTHRRRDQRLGSTRLINPGALGGVQYEARSICILDLATDQLEVILF
jgi:putative phosphoesterase